MMMMMMKRYDNNGKYSISMCVYIAGGGVTPGRARSNDLAGRSALALPCLLLCFGNCVNRDSG